MKKLIAVSLLAGLLSLPTVVFAEASWYGSIRAGVSSAPTENSRTTGQTGVSDFYSRWGIKGSSEVSEGLTAVYRYERNIDSTDASDPGGRLSYVGLSGSFGTITVGQVWSASYNSFGAIVDKSGAYGASDTTTRVGDAVSYAVTVGNLSVQADAIMDSTTNKSVDSIQVGATLGGLMETGSIAAAHIQHADVKGDGDKITFDGAIAPDYVSKLHSLSQKVQRRNRHHPILSVNMKSVAWRSTSEPVGIEAQILAPVALMGTINLST